jgi:transmembrane protein TMEM260 (protein O-mannosyltransferase)
VAERIAVASVVATLAFWAYTQTLLPGVDLGDTGGFQAAVLWPEVSARQAYPLYYGLARPFVLAASPDNPARALNLFSAIWAAVAVGLLTFLCASVTHSRAGGIVAGVLLAFSYTFWTQAVIAEVYSLHLALIGICLLALHAYAGRPNTFRLLVFLGLYAASFGNHFGMILMLVPFALFLIHVHPTPRALFRARIVLATLAIVIVVAALEYAPNFLAVWRSLNSSVTWSDRLATFWFDVTKQDWRETMVLGISPDRVADRLAMWWFDARQQFGVVGLGLALGGVVGLWRTSRPWAVLISTAYAMVMAFAFTYNVGDSHVFFMPGHYITAFWAGAAVAFLVHRWRGPEVAQLAPPTIIVALAVCYAGWRGWSTWPVVDRHDDRRGEAFIARLAQGVNESNALLVSQMNWQLENVLLYTARYGRPDLTWVRLDDVMAHWPFIVEDNQRLGRDVVMNGAAAAEVVAAYGPEFPLVEDIAVMPLPEAFAAVPPGAPYVLTILTSLSEYPLDPAMLADALAALTGGNPPTRVPSSYEIIAGVAGERPQLYSASNRPFAQSFRIADEPFTVRMDSWLPFDTFRRAGFGHVLRLREHVLTIERGVSLVWIARDGRPSRPYYAASLFADEPRYRVAGATLELARRASNGHRLLSAATPRVGANLESLR